MTVCRKGSLSAMTSDPDTDQRRSGGSRRPLWKRLRGILCAASVRMGARRDEAEDLAQESLIRVLSRKDRVAPDRVISYALVVCRNLWRDELRRRERRGAGREAGEAVPTSLPDRVRPEAEAVVSADEDASRLRAALLGLPARHRVAIELVVIAGLTYAEAGRRAGVPAGTMKSRVHYGIRFLRDRLLPDGSTPGSGEDAP